MTALDVSTSIFFLQFESKLNPLMLCCRYLQPWSLFWQKCRPCYNIFFYLIVLLFFTYLTRVKLFHFLVLCYMKLWWRCLAYLGVSAIRIKFEHAFILAGRKLVKILSNVLYLNIHSICKMAAAVHNYFNLTLFTTWMISK